MNFNNVYTNITRKSFGSRVDKTPQREGVIPVKDRKKDSGLDYVAESAKYNDLNKKVESRRLQEMQESKLYNIALQEGYESLKDFLIKDIISEICVESLLVDRDVVDNNLRNIVNMVNEKVDEIDGFNGINQIAESTGNQLLKNMISICEAICKKVGERNLKEACGKSDKLDFDLNKEEMEEFDYKKQTTGVETVVDIVKEKVLDVVQNEQKENTMKKEVMDEIEGKLQDLEAPVSEAMDAIFNKTGVEETTLFDSLLRRGYGRLLETESSAIFESLEVDNDCEDCIEDDEYDMSEIELVDDDGEGEDSIDDDTEDELMFESYKKIIIESIKNDDDIILSEILESIVIDIERSISSTKMRSLATKCKESIRNLQESIDLAVEEELKETAREAFIKEACKKKTKCYESDDFEDDDFEFDDIEDDENDIEEACKKKTKCSESYSVADVFALMEARCGKAKVKEADKPDIAPSDADSVEEAGCNKKKASEACKSTEACKSSKSLEELIICPICGEENCVCDENMDTGVKIEESLKLPNIKEKILQFIDNLNSRILVKKDFAKLRSILVDCVDSCCTNMKDLDTFTKEIDMLVTQLEKAKNKYPDSADKMDDQIKWVRTDLKKLLDKKRKQIEKESVVESFMMKLDTSCEKLDDIIETHELAYNAALESLIHEIDGETKMVPFIQPNDCNNSNIEFAYKVKLVCESLKHGLRSINSEDESMVIGRAVELNIDSINESLEVISNIENMRYKTAVLESSKKYLTKLQHVINNNIFNGHVNESSLIFNNVEDVERAFNYVKEFTLIESTNDSMMELVMAEAIVEYTILETFNTLRLKSFDRDSVRQMARRNLSK